MVWDNTRMAESINSRNRLFFIHLLESVRGSPEEVIGLMKGPSPEGRWLEECGMKHPTNKHERMMVNEKKKKEKQSRKQETENVSLAGRDNLEE